jgi:hypothetical protein
MKTLATVILVCLPGFASASPVVTGTDTFNPVTGLYTYSYTIDNTIGGGSGPINQLYILTNNIVGFARRRTPGGHRNPSLKKCSWLQIPGSDLSPGEVLDCQHQL